MQDKVLRKALWVKKNEYSDDGVEFSWIDKMSRLYDMLMVKNYFHECPCCNGKKEILKSEAVKFEKMESGFCSNWCSTYYTTKESYKIHKDKIKEWEEKVKEYKKTINLN